MTTLYSALAHDWGYKGSRPTCVAGPSFVFRFAAFHSMSWTLSSRCVTNGCSCKTVTGGRKARALGRQSCRNWMQSSSLMVSGSGGFSPLVSIRVDTSCVCRTQHQLKGRRAVSISITVQPTDQTSASQLCPSPVSTSGAIQKKVPMRVRWEMSDKCTEA